MGRQKADLSKGQKCGKLNLIEGRVPGEWAAARVDVELGQNVEIDDTLLNKVALIRGSKMVVEYGPALTLTQAQVPLVGVFLANSQLDGILKLSEPPPHNHWSPTSLRLTEFERGIVGQLLERLRHNIRNFHRELLPPAPKSTGRLRFMEQLLGRLLEGRPGIDQPEHTADPFQVTHQLERKHKDGRVRLIGKVKVGLRDDAEEDLVRFEYLPRVEVLENENLAAGEELELVQLKVQSGSARAETRSKHKLITGTIKKGSHVTILVESGDIDPEWMVAYRESILTPAE